MQIVSYDSIAEKKEANSESSASGVSWSAVIGGAFVAAALSLILLSLGAGLGLSNISPWANVGVSASTMSGVAIFWLFLMQIISYAMGGYTAGRLRTKWASIHSDEVHFRDTAHGLLVWAVGLVITVYFLTSAATTMVGGVGQVAVTTGAQSEGGSTAAGGYFADTLFRSNQARTDGINSVTEEAGRILANALLHKEISQADRSYLGQMVSARTGLSQPEAEKRVAEVIGAARQDADEGRKATAHLLLWLFAAMLTGAFCASYAATVGGRQRESLKAI